MDMEEEEEDQGGRQDSRCVCASGREVHADSWEQGSLPANCLFVGFVRMSCMGSGQTLYCRLCSAVEVNERPVKSCKGRGAQVLYLGWARGLSLF